MLISSVWLLFIYFVTAVSAAPPHQLTFASDDGAPHPTLERGVGHFSEWSACVKEWFLSDVKAGRASNWTIVLGNEAGDLDSLAAAFSYAYHVGHVNPSRPTIGLLQTPFDALDLRPENQLTLNNIKMTTGHQDLLTIDELPIPAEELASQVRGIVLVDHPLPLPAWEGATVLSLFDHHADRGSSPDAHPRVFERVASCSTLVGRQMLDELESLPAGEYHVPHELLELLLSAIAIDSGGLQSRITTPTDHFVASRLYKRSNWSNESFYDKMLEVAKTLKAAKKDLDHLSVRDLLRRDWKGGIVQTRKGLPDVHLGFASIPYSLSRLIQITPEQSVSDFFAIERNWTSEIEADITLALLGYKVKVEGKPPTLNDSETRRSADQKNYLEDDELMYGQESGEQSRVVGDHDMEASEELRRKVKERQIVLVVRADHRISEAEADSLFKHVSRALDESEILLAKRWEHSKQLGHRQMVWTHRVATGGRKLVRPIVESALTTWQLEKDMPSQRQGHQSHMP